MRYILILILLYSCTPQKRLARLVNKYPELIERSDTVVTYDTLISEAFIHDTLFYPVMGKRDTFTVYTPKGVTNVYLNEDKSEASVSHDISGDTTINRTKQISQYIDTFEERVNNILIKVFIGLFVLVLIWGVIRLKLN